MRKTNSGTSLVQPKHSGKIFVDSAVQNSFSNNQDDPVNKDTVSGRKVSSSVRHRRIIDKKNVTQIVKIKDNLIRPPPHLIGY